ncbi:MAG: hypothetical protein NTZ54_17145, partial [Alphaproteobacteria bacterium]|nr:hypothetical protein [Alphaproteobacteria bacterium]
SAISSRTLWAGLDFSHLLPDQIQSAEQEVKLWGGLERGRCANHEQVLELNVMELHPEHAIA